MPFWVITPFPSHSVGMWRKALLVHWQFELPQSALWLFGGTLQSTLFLVLYSRLIGKGDINYCSSSLSLWKPCVQGALNEFWYSVEYQLWGTVARKHY